MVGRIYLGDYYTLLYIKYVYCVPHAFREEGFLSVSHYKTVLARCSYLQGVAKFGHQEL